MEESFAGCVVCLDAFENSESKKPTVGVCGHSICMTCGRELRSNNQSRCPLCNQENSFLKETVNYQLLEMIDKFAILAKQKNGQRSSAEDELNDRYEALKVKFNRWQAMSARKKKSSEAQRTLDELKREYDAIMSLATVPSHDSNSTRAPRNSLWEKGEPRFRRTHNTPDDQIFL